jgi:hypothetical protein
MPMFVFQLDGSEEATRTELPSVTAAKCEAARYAAQLLCDVADTFWVDAEMTVTVSDEKGLILFTLTISGTDAPAIRISPTISA